jgi:restriction endonuclease S subunit
MSEEMKVPKHWEVKRLGEVCTYSKGKMPQVLKEEKSKECFFPYINIKAFEKGIFAEYTNGIIHSDISNCRIKLAQCILYA